MNREPETVTFDPAPEGSRRSRRNRGRRPRRAVMVTGAVALIAVAGGGYGVAQAVGDGGGDSRPAAGAASVRDGHRTTEPAAVAAGKKKATPTAGASAKPKKKPEGTGKETADPAKAGKKSGSPAKPKPKPTKKPKPKPKGTPAGGPTARLAQQVVEMVNAERARAGCSPVTVNAKLQAAAQGHSDDMAARDYYDHTTPEGKSPGDRMTAAGYRWSTYGENIFKSPKDARTAMDGWMKSQGHRDNILNCSFKEIGVGINLRANGPWWTQNFGASR
ncbi:CAP domain-containing protein [Streptomyces syringium]|uniref:CAP domain-containing protein n=1 Tax=Streptomyces syringium TaxID=76729 RepID=UPI0033C5B982